MTTDNVTPIAKDEKTKTPEQMIKEAQQKISSRRNSEFQKKIDTLIEEKTAAEKAVALVDKKIEEAIAQFKAGV